ncbi:MAG: hypothetical protein ACI8QC_001912 [Planctomycetota bacterium]|jgi:hypothetical protein
MSQPWIDLAVGANSARHNWNGPRLTLGGPGSDVAVPEPGEGELHLWSSPPKVVRVGKGAAPLLNGRMVEESALSDGDTLQWGGAVIVFRQPDTVLEELSGAGAAPKPTAPSPGVGRPVVGSGGGFQAKGDELRAWRRVLAGLMVEQGLADKSAAKRWQEAVMRNEFKADAAAEDVIAASSEGPDHPKVLERAGRLERDLMMMPLQSGTRGAGRGARKAVKGGTAFILANLLALGAYTMIVLAIAFLLRAQRGTSFDTIIDDILSGLGSLFGSA